ncbi:MAG: PEP-CTERM sorting domain-containing protein [Phycisphaerae bacterium]|nr:PEP-CTERM sorting domain-containing protein [Phycisphaerae bacterium]
MRAVLGAVLVLGLALTANAQLYNADMEYQPGGIYSTLEGWRVTGGGWADHANHSAPNHETLGLNFGFWSAGTEEIMGQVSTLTFEPDSTYTLASWAIGGGNFTGVAPYEIGYLSGGTSIATDFVALAINCITLDGQMQWEPQVGVTYTTGASGPEIGLPVVVRFGNAADGGVSDVWIDNVTLTPEPASLALLAMGALAVLRRR